jgi:glycerol-3-phosphate O-acyltransferase
MAWRRPAAESPEAVQLAVLAQVTVPILERYYLALALLLKAGSGRLSQEALERQCQLMAQRMALLFEIDSPEFFDLALFRNFVALLRERGVIWLGAEGRLEFQAPVLEAIVADAQMVLNEQVRNSILQVVHR